MKKILFAAMLLAETLTVTAQGNQKIIDDAVYDPSYNEVFGGTHPLFSYDGLVQLYGYSRANNSNVVFSIFDDNFDKIREWTVSAEEHEYTFQSFDPELADCYIEQVGEDNCTIRYDASSAEVLTLYDYDTYEEVVVKGAMTIEQARLFILRYYDRIIKEETTSEGTFFYISFFGNTYNDVTRSRTAENNSGNVDYPTFWFLLTTDGSLKEFYRSYTLRGNVSGYVAGRKESGSMKVGATSMSFLDYDEPYEKEASVIITQTLFNDDEEFEFIRPLVTNGLGGIYMGMTSVYNRDYGAYASVPSIQKLYGVAWTGFQVVSASGPVLQTVNFDGNFVMNTNKATLVRIHGKLYLFFYGMVLDEPNNCSYSATLIYTLDRQSNQIKKVTEHIGDVIVYPRVAERSENITVELTDEGGIREIRVVNANGQTELCVPVEASQKRVTIPAGSLNRGLNFVNTVGRKKQQAHKIIVK